MDYVLTTPLIMIATPADLASMLDDLSHHPSIAVDTESNSLFAYRERVCLIQLSTPQTDYIVDTLALADLAGMGDIFADANIEKVLHGADYDIGTLRRDYGFEFRHIFDTMIASRVLGIKQFGLGRLLNERFGVYLDKRMQRHDWSRRPLQTGELEYARLDSHYLLPLRDQLLEELRRCGREREAREAFKRVEGACWSRKPFNPDAFWHMNGALGLGDVARGVLKHLIILREELAQRLDRPPFKILSDETLMELARQQPTSQRAMSAIPGLSESKIRTLGKKILLAIEAGRRDPQSLEHRPISSGRPADIVLTRYERLRCWRKARAAKRGVDPDVLISNSLLMEIARQAPATPAQLSRIEGLGAYQIESYGPEILQIIQEDM